MYNRLGTQTGKTFKNGRETMPLIRYINAEGETRFGVDIGNDEAEALEGSILDGTKPAERVERVTRLLAPIVPVNIFGVGLNYRMHAKETGITLPQHPVIFMKPTSTVIGPKDTILLPASQMAGPEVDYEGELVAIIGKTARDVSSDEALEYVLGYTCGNDISARRWQKQGGGGQWVRGKSFDTFCPLGPRIALPEELPSPQRLALKTTLNGRIVQESNTSDMIFSVAEIISFLSKDTTLLPGTAILTGTPEGVGFVRKPPLFLQPGDTVSVEIDGIGTLSNRVEQA